MSGNVGGQDGNQFNIRLFNGKTFNLKKLDKLVGKSTEGSVFADYDSSISKGGNANKVFDEAEIAQIKNQLLQMQATDNSVSQEELNKMFGYTDQFDEYGKHKNFDANNLTSLLDSLEDEQEVERSANPENTKETAPQKEQQVYTAYTVQPGDTPEVIAKKLGFNGQEAKDYAKKLREHLKSNNQLDKNGWLRVGQKIQLLGDHAQTLAQSADYTEDTATLETRYAQTEHAKQVAAKEEAQKAAEAKPKESEPSEPEEPKDKTPTAQRTSIPGVKNDAKNAAVALKNQIAGASLNSNTREMLAQKVKNQNVAYIVEAYPDLVKDIDEEWGMDIADVKKYVISPLNSRLKELGQNKFLIPTDVDKMSTAQVQQLCQKAADVIRETDAENGYVFKPASGNEGKLHKPRNESQMDGFVAPKAKKAPNPTPVQTPTPAKTEAAPASEPKQEEVKFQPKFSHKDLSDAEYAQYLLPSELSLPKGVKDKLVDFRMNGFEPTLTQADDMTFKMVIKQGVGTNGLPVRMFDEEFGMLKPGETRTINFDAQGNPLNLQTKAGMGIKTTKNYSANGDLKPGKADVSVEMNTHTYGKIDAQRTVSRDDVAKDINISRTEEANSAQNKFANALENNKERIMAALGITNEQYDELAVMAMGIAEQETHYGAYNYHGNFQKRNIAKDLGVADFMYATGLKDGYQSHGITQMKFGLHYSEKNPGLKKQFDKLGITKESDFYKFTTIETPEGTSVHKFHNYEVQAVATMVLLNNLRVSTQNKNGTWAKLLDQNNALIDKLNAEGKIDIPEYKDGQFVRHNYGPHSAETLDKVRITEKDIIALRWNGVGDTEDEDMGELKGLLSRLKDPNDAVLITDNTRDAEGNLTHKRSLLYARNVRAYANEHDVTTSLSSANRAASLAVDSQGNNGRLGSVVFMPSAYTTNVKNSSDDIKILQDALSQSTIPADTQNQLLMAVKRGDIAFGYGLSADEAASLTENDAKLLLNKLDELKTETQNLVDPAKIRDAARKAQDAFRSDYLQSRQVVVNNNDVKEGMLSGLASTRGRSERLEQRGERKIIINEGNVKDFRAGAGRSRITQDGGQYYGFGVEADKGVNPYYADGSRIRLQDQILAECASDVAAIMDCGGRCATGVKSSLESAKVVESRSDIGFTNPDGTWNKCKNAKDLAIYFEKNPDKFEEVKYLDQGNGTSRELNATDIMSLPAGYIVVFIPGEGYENQAGHAVITNGNGQGYADEVDNLRWDDFKSAGAGSGKGEHGTFKIFRLKV